MTAKEAKKQHKDFLKEFRTQLEAMMVRPYCMCLGLPAVGEMGFRKFIREAAKTNFYSLYIDEKRLWTTIKINGFQIVFYASLYNLALLHKNANTRLVR